MLLLHLLLLLLTSLSPSSVLSSSVQRRADVLSSDWRALGRSRPDDPYEFTLHLRRRDDDLEDRIADIARRDAPWLTLQELRHYTAPSRAANDAVARFLDSHGIPPDAVSRNALGDQITVRSDVGTASRLFDARFSDWSHSGRRAVARTESYVLPASLAEYVFHVSPLTSFGHLEMPRLSTEELVEPRHLAPRDVDARAPAVCDDTRVTVNCVRSPTLYNYSAFTPKVLDSSAAIGVLAFSGSWYDPADLAAFMKKYRPDATTVVQPRQYNISGGLGGPSHPGTEGSLDMQLISGLTYPLQTSFYMSSDTSANRFATALEYVVNQADRPGVLSISFSGPESHFTQAEADAVCSAAQKLTALGTTVVQSTGDIGADNGECPPFLPRFPVCAHIVSVSATQNVDPERVSLGAPTEISGGAGFSNFAKRPQFQDAAVKAYLASLPAKYKGYFANENGKAYGDVSAIGAYVATVSGGQDVRVNGTGASTPIFASALALLNNARHQRGLPNVGPVLAKFYANPTMFKDITLGSAEGCDGRDPPATKGYDLPSGLGSPLLPAMLKAFGAA